MGRAAAKRHNTRENKDTWEYLLQLTLHGMYHRRECNMDFSEELEELNRRLKKPALPQFILEPECISLFEPDKQAALQDKIRAFCKEMHLGDPGKSIWFDQYATKPACLC